MNKLMMTTVLAALICGCVSVNQNDGGSDCRTPCVSKDIVHEKFKVEEKEVSAKDQVYSLAFFTWGSSATHTADSVDEQKSVMLGFLRRFAFWGLFSDNTAKAKNGAYANACDAAKCDQIVGAKYRVSVESYVIFKITRAEVTGYPASLTDVELIKNEEPCCK